MAAARPDALRVFWERGTRQPPWPPWPRGGEPVLRRLLPTLDAVLTYGGGPPVIAAYEAAGARSCVPVYNALDPREPPPRCRRIRGSKPISPSSATACPTGRNGWSGS